MHDWLVAFALTQLVEVPIYARPLAMRRDGGRRGLLPRVALAFVLSCPTHPFVFLVLPRLWTGTYMGYVAAAEAVAVLAEAALLHLLGVRAALTWAVLANVASTAVGFACRAAFNGP